MDELLNQLLMKRKQLDEIVAYSERILQNAPAGALRITTNKNTEQYYLRDDPEHNYGIYIQKKDMKLIQGLAQKEYAKDLLVQAKKENELLKKILNEYNPNEITDIYRKMSDKKRKLVDPYILPEEEYVKKWQSEIFEKKKVNVEEGSEICTEKGEIVRSKSEKIIADKLKLMNIPYHYEKPLYLNGFGVIYPDFTVLNVRTRREYYWEHFGMMDVPEYCEKAIRKIEMMQKNGFFLGEQLILTFETQTHPLNIKIVEGLINKHF